MGQHFERAVLLLNQSRFDLAEGQFRLELAEDPDCPLSHGLLAICLAEQQKYDEAQREAELAVHLAPDLGHAHFALAWVLHDRRKFREALEAIDEALRIDPYEARFFAKRAAILLEQGRWPEALKAAEEGLALDPEHSACVNLRAMALVKLGRKSQAAEGIEQALARDPEDALAHTNMGWTKLEQKDPLGALEHFREALRLEPGFVWAQQGIVTALKARYFVYRVMLSFFLWMSKLSPRVQWGLILGGLLGGQVLGRWADADPGVAPLVLPVLFAYLAFVILTWLANPLFDSVLRLNRFGWQALAPDQRRASNWLLLCLGMAVVALLVYIVTGVRLLIADAVAVAMLAVPLTATYRCAEGWPRRVMVAYNVVLALVASVGSTLFVLATLVIAPLVVIPPKLCIELRFQILPWGLLGAMILANILASVVPKR
jgi:tetratricopeptide (TPR) repeat protein